jgi:hypothetical protein
MKVWMTALALLLATAGQAEEVARAADVGAGAEVSEPLEVSEQAAVSEPTEASDAPVGVIRLDETVISGNQELPKVLYILPWRDPDGLPEVDLDTRTSEVAVFRRLYPPAYRRELTYLESLDRATRRESFDRATRRESLERATSEE